MTVAGSPFRLGLVTPVFNDWASFAILMHQISQSYRRDFAEFEVMAIDDGSTEPAEPMDAIVGGKSCIRSISVVELATNLGHQRAIAIGLVIMARRTDVDAVLVMDSDGEDRPEEIANLIEAARANPGAIILAERSKRSESIGFKVGYFFYRLLFRILTGQRVSSGNFSIIPFSSLCGVTHTPTLWNNLPATLIRSRYKLVGVPTVRGERYAGRSKMNLISLITHGLSGIAVYVDVIFVRLLVASFALIAFAATAILAAFGYKMFTNFATPGWATTVISAFIIIMLQAAIFMVGTTLVLLAGRSQYPMVPALDWTRFVKESHETAARQTSPRIEIAGK
jgi:polyisoprenyl-phosphate glycosyltransferase